VFHLAAITDTTVMDEAEMIRENAGGFRRLLESAAVISDPDQPCRVVYASSAATYGNPPQTRDRVPFPEAAAGKPNNVYGFSKVVMESIHRDFAAVGQTPPVVGLRYFNVYGPGESRKGKMASMVYQLAMQILEGKRPRLFEDGSQARDQVHVDDVVDCTMAAAGLGAKRDPMPGVYNLGSGVATSFNQIVEALRSALGLSERERPTEFFQMPASIRAFYQDYTCADMSRARQALGWSPKRRPAEAIADYGRWLKARHAECSAL